MPKEGSGNNNLERAAGVLPHIGLFDLLGASDTSAFSETCRTARDMSSDVRKKPALQSLSTALKDGNKKLFRSIVTSYPDFLDQNLILRAIEHIDEDLFRKVVKSRPEVLNITVLLKAVVCGNEYFAREIVTFLPELLLDSSAVVPDLSYKEIKNLTPLQAALCAWDVDMVEMIIKVLQHKLQEGIHLSFNPELEVQRQIATIYPNGDINAIEAAQMATAQEFKTTMLRDICAAINAATAELVKFELDNPGQYTVSDLNAALHNFRTQFATTANSEQIFNPFYLLNAIEFYHEQYNNFNGNADSDEQSNRRNIFWCQIIGCIQRHLPACLLQAFAQGISLIVDEKKKLKRDFKFRYGERYMRPLAADLNNLGYKWAAGRWGMAATGAIHFLHFKTFCEQKNQAWRTCAARFTIAAAPELPADPLRNRVRYSCCSIC